MIYGRNWLELGQFINNQIDKIPRSLDFKETQKEIMESPLKFITKWCLIPGRCYEVVRTTSKEESFKNDPRKATAYPVAITSELAKFGLYTWLGYNHVVEPILRSVSQGMGGN